MTDTNGNHSKNRDDSSHRDRVDARARAARNHDRSGSNSRRGQDRHGYRKGHQGRDKRGRSGSAEGRDDRQQRTRGFDHAQGPKHNPADLRSSNRPNRGRSPNIDDDVTGRELDKSVQRELGSLDEQNRVWVQKHLVMASRLIDEDPELAFEHALAASRRGGRLGVVREAAGMTAYAAGKFSEALREFRTYRRISGDNAHLPEMVDAERALGRSDKALDLASEALSDQLPVISRVELAMVVAGIHLDNGDAEAALKVLKIPQLNPRRGFSYSPRLFRAYAQALDAAGKSTEARKWINLAARAEQALGMAVEPDPEIIDLGDDTDQERPARARDVVPPEDPDQQTVAQGGDE